jgi:hypothetical protein
MSFQEKKAFVTLFSAILIFALYGLIVYFKFSDVILNTPNDLKFWGTVLLILIPVAIAANIIIHIVFVIINKIVTDEDAVSFMDELDKLIELKAIRNSHWVFVFGFFLSMGSQVLGMQPYVMFLTLIFFGFLSGIISEVTKIYLYRKGV